MTQPPKKFVPVMITPFDSSNNVDYGGLSSLVDFYLESGVHGLFANCLSSEMYSITESERLGITKHTVDRVAGSVPVVASGSFGSRLEDKAKFIHTLADTGIAAAIMITSHFASVTESDETLLTNFDKLFKLTGNIPLGMYECPAPYKRIIKAPVFRRLLESGRLIYHKDTSLEQSQVKAKLDIIKETENKVMEFYDAHTPNATFSLQQGARGMSSISGNFYPEILVWICKHAMDPEKQSELNWIQSELNRVDPLIHQAYPLSAKYFLQKRGLPIQAISRTYTFELTPDQKKVLDGIHTDFLGWCQRLGIKPVQ